LIDRDFELGHALSRGAEISKVSALSGLGLLDPREGVMGHRLVARRWGAQLPKSE
jgi:hypothetical protein